MSTRLHAGLRERVLDATGAITARHGLKKTTMEDVAREASCSRAGLYKHFSSKDALLQALFLREVERFLDELRRHADGVSGPKRLEEAFVFAVRYVREHPVAKAVIELDSEVFVSVFTRADQGLGETAVGVTASLVRILMQRGDVRRADPRVVAEALLRLLVSFVLVPRLAETQDEDRSMRRLFRQVVMKGIANQ